jgi:hypothetical protein
MGKSSTYNLGTEALNLDKLVLLVRVQLKLEIPLESKQIARLLAPFHF